MMTLEELYRKERRNCTKNIYRFTHNWETAEDVVQEAFVKALQAYQTYNPNKANLKTWFTKILFRTLWGTKKKLPPKMLSIEDVLESEYLISSNEINLKDYILNVKNEIHKEVLFAHYVLGYKLEETATCLGQTVANVKKVIHRFSIIEE
jgi:RNA polymerase sigma-70 factor (ECF subfamily)